jgi:acyl-CoA thioesterase
MRLPFVEHVGLSVVEQRSGYSKCRLELVEHHYNSFGSVHGGVLFTLADTGMGSALYPSLAAGEMFATIEVKINYFKPVFSGVITCVTEVVNRGKAVAHLESSLYSADVLVAKASGSYAIFKSSKSAA